MYFKIVLVYLLWHVSDITQSLCHIEEFQKDLSVSNNWHNLQLELHVETVLVWGSCNHRWCDIHLTPYFLVEPSLLSFQLETLPPYICWDDIEPLSTTYQWFGTFSDYATLIQLLLCKIVDTKKYWIAITDTTESCKNEETQIKFFKFYIMIWYYYRYKVKLFMFCHILLLVASLSLLYNQTWSRSKVLHCDRVKLVKCW